MDFLNSRIFLSVLYCEREYTAHKAAGIQPMRVNWNIKHIMPAKGRPMVKNTVNGKNIARSKRILAPFIYNFVGLYSSEIL